MPSEALAPLPPDLSLAASNVVPLELAGGTDFRPNPEDAVFAASVPADVQDLVETPCRALEVEYKSWRNLDHAEDRAELARDIAALANHGGGFIVFGFQERTLTPDDTDPFRTNCTTERIAAIVRTYLDPPVEFDLTPVVSAAGVVHPVIRIAGHGATPVCVRQDGPIVGNAKLVERGAYYIRKHAPTAVARHIGMPCPQSSRIEVPQEWAPLIRRCVRRDREALLGALEAAIDGRAQAPDLAQRLLTWHQAARAAFLPLVPRSPVADSLARRHYVLSYGFDLIRPETLEPAQLADALRRTVFALQPQFRSGWNMFDPPYRRAVQARFVVDPASGDAEQDFLETAWLRDRNPGETADFWRVSPRGLATIIRGYAEDMTQSPPLPPIRPGTCLSPTSLTQEVAELVCHARAFARLFGGVRRVAFRCEWWGLAGRELFDLDARWAHRGPAPDDRRVANAQVPVATLAQAWPEVVALLIAPVLRAFEPDLLLDADWVRANTSPA
ncbi:MAG: ATP-binding protein [Acetobacteraceae bacterium]|jgi:hypothetical protein